MAKHTDSPETKIITLTDAERSRFAAWLEQDASSSRLLLEQLMKLPAGKVVGEHMRVEAAACVLIARKLRSIEGA